MNKNCVTILTVVAVLFTASLASAQVSSIGFICVDNSSGGADLAGYNTYDLVASFAGQYTGSQLIVELSSGSIYQNGILAGRGAPSAGLASAIPATAYDTFIAQGSPTADGPFGNPSAGGGAVDLGGAPGAVFSTSAINQAWNPAGGVKIVDQTNFLLARMTLSNTATGTAHVLVSAANDRYIAKEIPIPIFYCVPESTSLALSTLGLVCVVGTRRRS